MKIKVAVSLAFIALVFALTGFLAYAADTSNSNDGSGAGKIWGAPPFTGTVKGSSPIAYGRKPITVTLKLTEGRIVDVKFNLSGETPSYVKGLQEKAKTQMVNANTWDVPVDTVSGVTKSVDGMKDAAKKALLQIPQENNN
jgi:uncharacterized protein with FMN-binding domain